MANYYVNKNEQSDGYHEVHIDDNSCSHPPEVANRRDLGWHLTCAGAIEEARKIYAKSDGCYYCIPECHTR